MYRTFRKTVEKIIQKYGEVTLEEFYVTESKTIKIKKDHFLDFSIEKSGNMLFIGYYREQNGDLISDPIFVFEIRNDQWYPIRVEQVFGDSEIGYFEDGSYSYYPRRYSDVRSFSVSCANEWKAYYL